MNVQTSVKAGALGTNHNVALAIRTGVRAGGGGPTVGNHNEALAVRTGVKAGGGGPTVPNHNVTPAGRVAR